MAIRSRRLESRRRARRGQGVARRRGRPPGRNTGDDTHDRIIEAAVKLFSEKGYGSTSVRDIAHRARVRVSTLYHYFRSKEEMYGEVRQRGEDAIRALVVSCLDQDLEFGELVRQLIDRLFDFLLEHRDEARLAFEGSLARGPLSQWEPPNLPHWVGLTEGVMRPAAARGAMKEVDPALFIVTVDGILHWHVVNEAMYRRIVGKDLRDPETAARAKRHIGEFIFRGLGIE